MSRDARAAAAPFPSEFDFYHLGRVSPEATPEPASAESASELEGYAFTMSGAARGAVFVLLEPGLDAETYSELANVMASRIADGMSLAEGGGLPVLPSPPRRITGAQALELARKSGSEPRRASYQHFTGGQVVPVEVWILA